MRNFIKPLDISLVPAEMGRILTTVVALIVLGLTVHAVVTEPSPGELTFAVPASGDVEYFEPLQRIVARQTGLPVVLVARGEQWTPGSDMYWMPSADFIAERGRLGLRAVICGWAAEHDRAVIVGSPVSSQLRPGSLDDIGFWETGSYNACWAQLRAMAGWGAEISAPPARERAEGSRVVHAVALRSRGFAACRQSDLDALAAAGEVSRGEVAVVHAEPAVAEWVLAVRGSVDVERALWELPAVFHEPSLWSGDGDAVRLLRERGVVSLRVATEDHIAALEELAAFAASQ